MSLYARLAALIVAVLAIAAAWWKLDHALSAADARGYARALAEAHAVAEAQEAKNRELQRAAELRYTVAAEVRDRYIVTTVKEIHDAAAPLATCPVGPDAVRLLNAAAACARQDSAAACGSGDAVRGSP